MPGERWKDGYSLIELLVVIMILSIYDSIDSDG